MNQDISGLWPAVLTPVAADGALDLVQQLRPVSAKSGGSEGQTGEQTGEQNRVFRLVS